MIAQDFYYDLINVKTVLKNSIGKFKRCFIVIGYYELENNLAMSPSWSEQMITDVFKPIFGDIHGLKRFENIDPWNVLNSNYENDVESILKITHPYIYKTLWNKNSFFNDIQPRVSPFADGRTWSMLSSDERKFECINLAKYHNRLIKHKDVIEENRRLMNELLDILNQNGILPIILIPHFPNEYIENILPDHKAILFDSLEKLSYDVRYVDLNDLDVWDIEDMHDHHHMSARGAYKASIMLDCLFCQ